jgi:hypothetical protein
VINPCPRAGRWIGGCKFEARYDESSPDQALRDVVEVAKSVPSYVIKMLIREKTYIHDVCTRCGKVIKREAS